MIDASQSVGAMPLDVGRLRPDFLVASATSGCWGRSVSASSTSPSEHRDGEPLEQNWIARAGSEDFARLVDYRDEYQPGARRFDIGQRTSFHLVPMAIAALEQILAWEVARIAATLGGDDGGDRRALCRRSGSPLAQPDQRGPHMLGVGAARRRARVDPARALRRPAATQPCAERRCGSPRISTSRRRTWTG